MKRKSGGRDGKSAVDILEEAMHLLRATPLLLAPYYIGSLPFVLGLLYFWTDMSTGANAWQHCSQAAWGLTLFFIWMKTWQSVYARRLLARVRGETSPPWGIRRILRAAAIQTAIQPWSIVVLPVAFIIMLPFPPALAFFQNATLIGSGDEGDMRVVVQKSWHQASLWPMQNTLVIWLTSPFLLVLCRPPCLRPRSRLVIIQSRGIRPLLFYCRLLAVIPLCPLGVITALNIGRGPAPGPWAPEDPL